MRTAHATAVMTSRAAHTTADMMEFASEHIFVDVVEEKEEARAAALHS